MNKELEIATIGNKILRQRSKPITNIKDPQILKLINSLITTAISNNGVGIAAPQVSFSERLFIVASRPSIRYPYAPKMNPTPMINPKIISYSGEREKDWEGCLSVPDRRGLIPRDKKITVEYTTIEGKIKQQELTDFVARIFQHELDHLDGILFVDRLESDRDLYTEEEYLKQLTIDR